MNKLVVLAKNKETYFVKRLIDQVGLDRLLLIDPWQTDSFALLEHKVLVRTSGIYGGEADLALLNSSFRPENIFNPLTALRLCRNKKIQYEAYAQWGIPILPWLDLSATSTLGLREFIDAITFSDFLIKPHRGQGGWGIKVFDRKELISWFEQNYQGDRDYLLQPFLGDARELRYFFVKEWGVTFERLKYKAPGANFRLGGGARIVNDHDDLLRIANKIKKLTGIIYGAIDLLETPQGLMVLEVNAVPGIEQVEQTTRDNALQRILNALN